MSTSNFNSEYTPRANAHELQPDADIAFHLADNPDILSFDELQAKRLSNAAFDAAATTQLVNNQDINPMPIDQEPVAPQELPENARPIALGRFRTAKSNGDLADVVDISDLFGAA